MRRAEGKTEVLLAVVVKLSVQMIEFTMNI